MQTEITYYVVTIRCKFNVLIFFELSENLIYSIPQLGTSVSLVGKHLLKTSKPALHMYRQIMHPFGSFHYTLAYRRVGVDDAAEFVGGGFKGHRDYALGE